METFYKIFLETLKISTLLFGILGVLLSFLLIFSLDLTKIASNFFNRFIDLDQCLKPLDENVETKPYIYKHSFLWGTSLFSGSLFLAFFLYFRLNIKELMNCLNIQSSVSLLVEVLLSSIFIFGKITSILGLVIGTFLTLLPKKMKMLEEKISYWIITQPFEEKLNEMHKDTDTICFLHSVIIGTIILIASSFLTIISLINLIYSK